VFDNHCNAYLIKKETRYNTPKYSDYHNSISFFCKNQLYNQQLSIVPTRLQGFIPEHMFPWKTHWDHQLYKALEFQYRMGLEALNENLPEIRVDITYR